MQICHLPRRRTITSALSAVKMLSLILLSIGVITANLPYIVAVSVDDRNDGGGKSIVFFFLFRLYNLIETCHGCRLALDTDFFSIKQVNNPKKDSDLRHTT